MSPADPVPTPRGRRPGASDTRDEILAAARTHFAEQGFGRTTIRAVAASAGVDPALVHHYFGSKNDLFVAALQMPVDPREVLVPALAGSSDDAAERLLRAFLGVWDDPEMQLPLLGVVRGMLEPDGQRLLADGFLPAIFAPVAQAIGITEPERRMPIVASQVLGLIMVRYVLRIEPVASMSADQVVAVYAPTIQRYLMGELGPPDSPASR